MDARWKFPYDKINRKEKIVLYGAGRIGSTFKKQIEEFCFLNSLLRSNESHDNTHFPTPPT